MGRTDISINEKNPCRYISRSGYTSEKNKNSTLVGEDLWQPSKLSLNYGVSQQYMFKFITVWFAHLCILSFSAVQDFINKYNPIIPEMHDLANDSEFGEYHTSVCYEGLNKYLELANGFEELVRLVSLVNSTRDTRVFFELRNISVAVYDFLSRLHKFWVSENLNSLKKYYRN